MVLFQNKYRVESMRFKDWDYSSPWWYYVTINTQKHEEWFGKVVKDKMQLNTLGQIVEEEWLKTKMIRKNIDLDCYIVMPNHFHGIIILNKNIPDEEKSHENNVEMCRSLVETDRSLVETRRGESLREKQNEFGKPIKNSLSVIINEFKGSVKRWANKNNHEDFFWQTRFYDRIIRNERELFNIRRYIELNPMKWELEKGMPENIEF